MPGEQRLVRTGPMLRMFSEHLTLVVMRESLGSIHHSKMSDCRCRNKNKNKGYWLVVLSDILIDRKMVLKLENVVSALGYFDGSSPQKTVLGIIE